MAPHTLAVQCSSEREFEFTASHNAKRALVSLPPNQLLLQMIQQSFVVVLLQKIEHFSSTALR
jgi:hypothetical protein